MLSLSKQATYPWVELVACPEPVEGKPGQAGYAESRLLGFDTLRYSTGARFPGFAHGGLFLKVV